MGLKDRSTVFKDLKYGHDRIDGGSSNQPYIKTPLNVKLPPAFNFLGSDFILRGGPIGAPLATANDLARLTKYFADVRTPSGLLFIAKQNLLSRTAVRTQASGKLVNEGVYTPLSTLAQAGVSAFGLHLNKQGLNPIPGGLGSLRTYSDVVTGNSSAIVGAISNLSAGAASLTGIAGNLLGGAANPLSSLSDNRLVALYGVKIDNSKASYLTNSFISVRGDNVNLISYQGGPGSFLGIGLTNIQFADQRTGVNNPNYGKNPNYLDGLKNSLTNREKDTSKIQKPLGASTLYKNLHPKSSGSSNITISFEPQPVATTPYSGSENFQYVTEATDINDAFATYDEVIVTGPTKTVVYTEQEILDNTTSYWSDTKKIKDFRELLRKKAATDNILKTASELLIPNSPDYATQNIENRVNLGDPGNRALKNLTSYTKGIGTITNGKPSTYYGAASETSFDQITVLPLYKSSGPADAKTTNDLVQFRIAAIDNTDPNKKVYMHFRAFLDSFNDAYTGNWSSAQYVGRGENFYTYDGFDRKISLSFTVAAQSKIELIPMYKKLNYLASNLAPDYSGYGLMRGPLVQLTVGGYLREMPGFITSLTYDVVDNTSWEIGIDDDGNSDKTYDSTVKELPHMIKVTGFNFTPIHPFVPRKVLDHDNQKSKYIALSVKGHKSTDLSNYTTPNITLKDLQNEAANANDTKENSQDI